MPRQCQAATQRVECTPVQQRTTHQVPESAFLVICHSSEEHQISPDILTVSSQTPVPQLLLGKVLQESFTSPSSLNDTSESKPFTIREPTLP